MRFITTPESWHSTFLFERVELCQNCRMICYRRNAYHKFTTVSLTGNRLRYLFVNLFHILDNALDNLDEIAKGF
jgi:hypothetical protein